MRHFAPPFTIFGVQDPTWVSPTLVWCCRASTLQSLHSGTVPRQCDMLHIIGLSMPQLFSLLPAKLSILDPTCRKWVTTHGTACSKTGNTSEKLSADMRPIASDFERTNSRNAKGLDWHWVPISRQSMLRDWIILVSCQNLLIK